MNEPKYDEDVVNLGYLKKFTKDIDIDIPDNINKHYTSRPNPPYSAGDTWIDGNMVYTCIQSREIGLYDENDWVTESGARAEAKSKNKIFLSQPSNYSVGDMWILQSDSDHRAGKRGEILITTVGRTEYDDSDWVNMLSYGDITSINEVLNTLNRVINEIETEETKQNNVVIVYYQANVPTMNNGDLWYVTEDSENYSAGELYEYVNNELQEIIDQDTIHAFSVANEEAVTGDGQIKVIYADTEPSENISVGDIWNNTLDDEGYRYNGTNWVRLYETNAEQIAMSIETLVKTVVNITTDFGQISQTVSESTQAISNLQTQQEVWETNYNQDKDSFQFNINNINQTINDTNQETNERIDEIHNYLRYEVDEHGVGTVILGTSESPILLKEKNDKIYFEQNGIEVAYISNNKLFITDGEFLSSLKIGKFAYLPRSNGNLSFKKVVD